MRFLDTILVTGSRNIELVGLVSLELSKAFNRHTPRVHGPPRLVHGACPTGVDQLAEETWLGEGWSADSVVRYPVDHALDGPWPGAGPRRNARMVTAEWHRILVVLAVTEHPDGTLTRGTASCVREANRYRLPVEIVLVPRG